MPRWERSIASEPNSPKKNHSRGKSEGLNRLAHQIVLRLPSVAGCTTGANEMRQSRLRACREAASGKGRYCRRARQTRPAIPMNKAAPNPHTRA